MNLDELERLAKAEQREPPRSQMIIDPQTVLKLVAMIRVMREALEWISGKSDKPHCTYYERTLDDGESVPPYFEIAERALAEVDGGE